MLYALLRRVPVPGVARLRRVLRVPNEGVRGAGFPGGVRLRLDLRESIQRDWYMGIYDRSELRLVRDLLSGGGDFVDVGAHVGMYTVTAARALGARGRVLALEPNPAARRQLEENLRLNGCTNVVVVPRAAAAARGQAVLHVPDTPDPSFSSLQAGRFAEGEPVAVETTTVDEEVEAARLSPGLVKIDVEGAELEVLAGMEKTLERRPRLLVEVGPETAAEAGRFLAERGYEPGPELEVPGLVNVLFAPRS
jgi:FkbM family methyltransferase